ncbi:unnamed protein product, partial [Prorocentrum cordatum]
MLFYPGRRPLQPQLPPPTPGLDWSFAGATGNETTVLLPDAPQLYAALPTGRLAAEQGRRGCVSTDASKFLDEIKAVIDAHIVFRGELLVGGPLPPDFEERFVEGVSEAARVPAEAVRVLRVGPAEDAEGADVDTVVFTAPASVVQLAEDEAGDSNSDLARGPLHVFLVDRAARDGEAPAALAAPAAEGAGEEAEAPERRQSAGEEAPAAAADAEAEEAAQHGQEADAEEAAQHGQEEDEAAGWRRRRPRSTPGGRPAQAEERSMWTARCRTEIWSRLAAKTRPSSRAALSWRATRWWTSLRGLRSRRRSVLSSGRSPGSAAPPSRPSTASRARRIPRGTSTSTTSVTGGEIHTPCTTSLMRSPTLPNGGGLPRRLLRTAEGPPARPEGPRARRALPSHAGRVRRAPGPEAARVAEVRISAPESSADPKHHAYAVSCLS